MSDADAVGCAFAAMTVSAVPWKMSRLAETMNGVNKMNKAPVMLMWLFFYLFAFQWISFATATQPDC